jgi:hypothetical protein
MTNKYNLTDSQYNLIRNALETFYYVCKDDGELRPMCDEITKLETSLIEQGRENEYKRKKMVEVIHDCYLDIMDKEPTNEIIGEIAEDLTEDIKADADKWGWTDTEVADRVYQFIETEYK